MKRKGYLITPVIAGLVGVFAFLFLGVIEVGSQGQPTALPVDQTSTPTLIPTATATFTMDQQAGDLLKTYKEVLEVSKNTVEEVHTTANNVLDVVGVIFTFLSIVLIGGTGFFTWFSRSASDKADAAQQKATEALDNLKKLDAKTIELEKRNGSALQTANELTQKQNDLGLQIGAAEKLLHSLQTEIAQVKSSGEQDRQFIKKPLTLVQIDEYIMQALSGNPKEKEGAKLSLIEMSNRSDAVVRRKTIKALGMLDEYDVGVVSRLKEVIETDSAQGVRKEAQKTLKLIEAKKPKTTTRRKS